MTAKVVMVQGTASHAGKSILVTALCRIYKNRGLRVAPFKAQNMSLNSFVTPDGGEIGRAQAVQAEASCIPPSVAMNPILLKPEANHRSQIVVMGRPWKTSDAAEYYKLKAELWPVVTSALDRLRSEYDMVVIEGAGSPAEINFAEEEIVNMSVARYCQSPILLIGDIERGGVFASLLGTVLLLEPDDRKLIKAFIINKFRGDQSLLDPGLRYIEKKTGVPVAGVIPYFRDIQIAQEDSVSLDDMKIKKYGYQLDIAVIRLPHISNFDDFDPLTGEEGIGLRYVSSIEELHQPDLIILPGSKTTIADMSWLRTTGLAERIINLHNRGSFVIGICGGYQMLGNRLEDPYHIESEASYQQGLGLLPVSTTFLSEKDTHQVKVRVVTGEGLLKEATGIHFEGYEIHMGRSNSTEQNVFCIAERSGQLCNLMDGCLSGDGRIMGTYIHGLFNNRDLTRTILNNIAQSRGKSIHFMDNGQRNQNGYDKLAELIEGSLDMKLIYAIAGLESVKKLPA